MGSSRRALGPAVFAVLLLLLGAAPPGHTYKGTLGGFDSGGGLLSGGVYRSVASLGSQTSGTSASNAHAAQEGFLAFYGQPMLGADPSALGFGVVALGGSLVRSATVSNYGGVSLLLSDVRLASSGTPGPFAIESGGSDATIAPGGSVVVGVRFTPVSTPLRRDTLLANTNDPAAPLWRLPLSGSGLGSAGPVLTLSVDSLDFGSVPIDSMAVRALTIRNTGGATLDVGPMTTSRSAFEVSTAALTVPPGGAHDLSVWFDPDAAEVYRDTLFVPSNDPAHTAPAVVLLTGRVPAMLAITEPSDKQLFFDAAEDGPAPPEQPIRIRNEGAETLRWEASAPGASWIEIEPDSGSVLPGNSTALDIGARHQGLSAGEYRAAIRLANKERPLAVDSVMILLTVEPFSIQVSWTPAVVEAGGAAEVRAAASLEPDSGRVFYRKSGAGVFESVRMTGGTGGALIATLSGSVFDIRGLESYVMVHAGGRTVVDPKPLVEKPKRIAVRCKHVSSPALAAGQYQMVSIPLAAEGASVADILEDDLGEPSPSSWRLGRWSQEEGRYREHPDDLGAPLDAGFGFWIITREDRKFGTGGLSVFPPDAERHFPIRLAGGAGSVWWIQIGHPFAYPVSWSDCLIRDADRRIHTMERAAIQGLVENAAYSYVYEGNEGRYEHSSVLAPWRGYFVNNLSGGDLELLVPMEEASPAKAIHAPTPLSAREGEWELPVRAAATTRSASILVGERKDARDGWDSFDHYLPPAPDGAAPLLAIRASDRMPAPGDLCADLRAVRPGIALWDLAVRFEGGKETRLSIEAIGALPAGYAALLEDTRTGAVAALERGASYRAVPYPGEELRQMRLAIGPAEELGAEGYELLLPEARFALERPFPNPARDGTTIRFAIPETENIQLQLFNIEGRLVRDLASGSLEAGEHIASWDGKDARGRRAAPGVYFFRLDRMGETRTARVVVFR
ncbi:MAG: choice-of-anchor D domain-containing protein [Candidatus Eisenbacteria bacterium]|nr:choice-of-anchor D domain-containing protein [Candidatus Eisenbacteria bacterium]